MVGTLSGEPRHILLAGGGHAHAVALHQLAKDPPQPETRLTLVSPSTHNLYSGALPGVIAGHWQAEDIGVPLQPLCGAIGAQFIQDRIAAINPESRTAILGSGETITFDVMSLDIGSGIRPLDVPGSDGAIIPVRPIAPFLQKWESALEQIKAGSTPSTIIVAGAGLAGIEVALAIHYRLLQEGITTSTIHLIDPGDEIAGSSAAALRRRLYRALGRYGINLMLQTSIRAIENGCVTVSTGAKIAATLIVNCAGSAPHDWVAHTGLKTANGRIEVDACLRSTSHSHIWAAGDTSYFQPKPLAPAGVFAVRAGPVIAENIRRFSRDKDLAEYHPQSDYLKLVSLGQKRAVAEKFGLTLEGGWVWRLKRSIDFSFLRDHSPPSSH
jgi:pyridine nucleotide-disulfide oxidoreductase family protein